MKVLMVSTDRKVFDEKSAVCERIKDYGRRVDELHLVVFSRKDHGFVKKQIAPNIFLYPTSSRNRWWYIFDAIRIGKEILKKEDTGLWLVTTQDSAETGIVGWWLKVLFDIPLQLQLHTDMYSPYFKFTLLNQIRVLFSMFLLPRADSIRVVSKRIRKSLIARGISEEKITVLPIAPLSLEASHTSNSFSKPFETMISMVGRLEREKNIVSGIHAFAKVALKDKSVGLVIVGDGSLRAQLEKRVRKLGLSKRIQFLGWVDGVDAVYQSADIFLHTALYEGYGLVLHEAASHKLPIVTTDVGIVGDVLKNEESALVCKNPLDITCLAQQLSRLIESKELRNMLGEKAYEHARAATVPLSEYASELVMVWKNCIR